MTEQTCIQLFNKEELDAVRKTDLPTTPVSDPLLNLEQPYAIIQTNHDAEEVERVARAIWDADRINAATQWSWRTATEGHREDYRNMARGALIAMEATCKKSLQVAPGALLGEAISAAAAALNNTRGLNLPDQAAAAIKAAAPYMPALTRPKPSGN